jgi:hypothetical protein
MLPSFLRKDGFMAKKKVPELLVDVLAEEGVQRIYGVSGDSLNGITTCSHFGN